MDRKRRITRWSRHNIAVRGKGGFTLVELCIVLALVAVSSTMIVSFSASMKRFAASNAEEYDFLEDCAIVKEELYKWIAENDTPGVNFNCVTDGIKVEAQNESSRAFFRQGFLYLGVDENNITQKQIKDLKTIDAISFEKQNNLIKCTITSADSEGREKTFVFALRCATAQGGGE